MSDLETAMRERAEARVGQVLRGKWKLDRLLGVGGMACVYAATHRNGKRGAVKLLHPELATSEAARARFLREGYVANTVAHPGAVSVLDDDTTEDGAVFLVMELLEGGTIDALAASRPEERLELGEVLAIADELLDILAAAHDKGIVHRDLKPENLFVSRDGRVHVLDFGIARLRQQGASATATRTGETMGTPAFMPPEQALGEWDKVDGRSDIWSVGATMFTLLTGQFVHDAETVQKMMLAAMTKPAPPLATVLPGVPAGVATIVDRALLQAPEARWADAREMQSAVRAVRHEFPANLGSSLAGDLRAGALGSAATALARDGGLRPSQVLTAAPVATDTHSTGARRLGIVVAGAVAALAIAGAGAWFYVSRAQAPASQTSTGDTSAKPRATVAPIAVVAGSSSNQPVVQPSSVPVPQPTGVEATAEPSASAAQVAKVPAQKLPSTAAPTTGPTARPTSTPVTPPPSDNTFHGRF